MQSMNLNHLFDYDDEGTYTPPIERVALDILNEQHTDRTKISAAAKAAVAMMNSGMKVDITPQQSIRAQELFIQGEMPNYTDMTNSGIVIKLEALLNEYDKLIVKEANQIRQFVTNRLIEEADPANKNPAQRLKALELLGKMTDVGLFTERSVITIQQMPTEQLEKELKKSLTILLDPEDYSSTITSYNPPADAEIIIPTKENK